MPIVIDANLLIVLVSQDPRKKFCRRNLLKQFKRLPISYHPSVDGVRVIEIALQLKRQNAYDAAYLALAETLDAEL